MKASKILCLAIIVTFAVLGTIYVFIPNGLVDKVPKLQLNSHYKMDNHDTKEKDKLRKAFDKARKKAKEIEDRLNHRDQR